MGLRVLVLCADIGEGHVTVAQALTASLRDHERVDAVELRTDLTVMGARMGRFMDNGFRTHIDGSGWSYDLAYRVFFEPELPRRAGQLALALLGGRGLRRTIADFKADVVVAEYPVLSAALGELRALGRLPVPVCSSISDPAGLYYWAHPGVDMHLLSWPQSLAEADRIAGPGKSTVVRPAIDARYMEPLDRASARAELGLPMDVPVVVVSGGGWGMGDLAGAAEVASDLLTDGLVVALAGRSEDAHTALSARFAQDRGVRVLGFTRQMPELLMAADALIHTTGGTTALEAQVVGCPLINFGSSVAHVRAHARALAELGMARWAPDRQALEPALRATLAAGRRQPMVVDGLPRAADVVVGVAGR
ncbi:MAG TPA: glycosyltransferase [Solirubrobacteraceae bacterium]|jgi:UDP-N-acetylglucosamine:LPS N-acetylglucosamine transferase|nr:glycosyltransferase [Solirubrobacteraceae bacterium]